jgi:hydroxyacylglutathione hydrolase
MTNIWRIKSSDHEYEIFQIPCLKDSFTYLISSEKVAIAIDPADGGAIQKEINEHDLNLEAILITHHHKSHCEDALFLKTKTDATIIGPHHEELSFVNQEVMDEDEFLIAPVTIKVISLPGHTLDSVGYYLPDCKSLFSGDALYLGGSGKMLEGDKSAYFHSLQKIKKLPKDTMIFGGHHIVFENVRTLEEEMELNPFLKAENEDEFFSIRNALDKELEKFDIG